MRILFVTATRIGTQAGPIAVQVPPGLRAFVVTVPIPPDALLPGDRVDVIGTSRGKGFQGVVKRHHFAGGRATHGSMFHRAPGSIGASSFPSRVVKGMRMGGHMGADRVTVRNLKVIRVDAENNLLLVRGAVPGPNGTLLVVQQTNLIKKVAGPGAPTSKKKKAGAK